MTVQLRWYCLELKVGKCERIDEEERAAFTNLEIKRLFLPERTESISSTEQTMEYEGLVAL